MKKVFKRIAAAALILVLAVFAINCYVVISADGMIMTDGDISRAQGADCIIVPGAGIRGDRPSPMLADRLDRAIELYKSGAAPKLLMSGDHGSDEHDEVNVMKNYAMEQGVPSEDIFMDHAGFSSYDTMYRAKEIFGVNKAVVVTQKYHLFRSLYIAKRLGIDAVGAGSDPRSYRGAVYREAREVLARDKDFFKCIFKPAPKLLGEAMPVNGDGNVTNDKTAM